MMPGGGRKVGHGSLKILGRANSFNVRKVLWLCEELGVSYEREDYGRGYRPTSTPDFLKLNPFRQIPVVIDAGHVLRESNSILRYLASREGAVELYPSELRRRALVEQWMDWVAYDVTHALRGAFLGGQLQEPPWNNPWYVAQGRRDLISLMRAGCRARRGRALHSGQGLHPR
jgi:glutathione S-transferase